jgi:hypothetical protein
LLQRDWQHDDGMQSESLLNQRGHWCATHMGCNEVAQAVKQLAELTEQSTMCSRGVYQLTVPLPAPTCRETAVITLPSFDVAAALMMLQHNPEKRYLQHQQRCRQ